MEAVTAKLADPEVEVDLRGCSHGDRHNTPMLASAGPYPCWGRCSAIRANCATSRVSPRALGSIPASRKAISANAGDPAQPARAARKVLRRWPNAASVTANTSSRVAVVWGGSCRSMATSPESTRGAGQNTWRPIVPAIRADPYQAALTDGTPYGSSPGLAASRAATSNCTITSTRRTVGSRASNVSSTGTATLYGRFATIAVG